MDEDKDITTIQLQRNTKNKLELIGMDMAIKLKRAVTFDEILTEILSKLRK